MVRHSARQAASAARKPGRPAKNSEPAQKPQQSAKETTATSTPARRGRPPSVNASSAATTPTTRRSSTAHNSSHQNSAAASASASKSKTAHAQSTRKRKSTRVTPKYDDTTEEEDEHEQLTTRRRGAYLDEQNSGSFYADEESMSEQEDESNEEEDEFAAEDDEEEAEPEAAGEKRFPWERAARLKSPPCFDQKNLPRLELPPCSQDLLLPQPEVDQLLLQICSVYEILRHFKHQLRLSTFRIEEFIAALKLDEMNSLCSEIHITLLKVLVKEDEINNTIIGAADVKDSVNMHLFCCDPITWPQVMKMYLRARAQGQLTKPGVGGDIQAKRVVEMIYNTNYPVEVTLETKLNVLQYLCDSFLETSAARSEISNVEAMIIVHDDHCRKCHKLGDLLCCDNCPSVWHLNCLEPPLSTIPSNDWVCHICRAMHLEGVEAASVRKEILGWDRHGRKYWWLCQRLIVEESSEPSYDDIDPQTAAQAILARNEALQNRNSRIHYYSSRRQFHLLLQSLDRDKYEKELYEILEQMKDEFGKGFDSILQATQAAIRSKGLVLQNVRSWLEADTGDWTEASENSASSADPEAPTAAASAAASSAAAAVAPSPGIVTRLKTGAIQPKSANDRNSLMHQAEQYPVEDRETLYVWDSSKNDQYLKRTLKKQIPNLSQLVFKLGMDARPFVNFFVVNILALNKYQHQEERDKKRQLSWKFSLSPLAEFRWFGPVYGSSLSLLQTLRQSIIHFEGSLLAPFLHPSWNLHRPNWLKAVQMCDNAKDFALAISILESSIKPVLFNPVWNDSVGHNLLERTTLLDREERKRLEKRERRDQTEEIEMLMRTGGGVKYTLMQNRCKDGGQTSDKGVSRGVHQLWRQKGEEYRATGKGGWIWRSATRAQPPDGSTVEVKSIDELTEAETAQTAQTETINVMRSIRELENTKRIFYPKHFVKAGKAKLQLLEGLLARRVALEQALNVEAKKNEQQQKSSLSEPKADNGQTLKYMKCYSPICRLFSSASQENIEFGCYADCPSKPKADEPAQEKPAAAEEQESMQVEAEMSEQQKEISETFGCTTPVYLYKVNERQEVQRKLNTKRILGKGQLPPCSKFSTRSGKKSIFVIPSFELKKLSRHAGLREVKGFSYVAKHNPYIWPFGSTPRPLFRTCWLYRNSIIEKSHGIEAVAVSLRIIWSCIRWDEMVYQPATTGPNTLTTDTEVITTELLRRRDLAPFGLRSEYLVRKIIVPIDYENEKGDNDWKGKSRSKDPVTPTWKREGLRERKKKQDADENRRQGPSVSEAWTPEEELQLWEIRGFGEKLEKQQQMIKEKEKAQREAQERARKKQAEEQARRQNERKRQQENKLLAQKSQNVLQQQQPPQHQQQQQSQQPQQHPAPNTGESYAMIRTAGGNTYKIPLAAVQGRQPGQQIVIKIGGGSSNQLSNTTNATILQILTPPAMQNATIQARTTLTPSNQSNQIVQRSTNAISHVLSNNASNLAATSNSVIKQTIVKSPAKPQMATASPAPLRPTLKTGGSSIQSEISSSSSLQIPIRFADGRVQMICLPASVLNATGPIQIQVPSSMGLLSAGSSTTTPIILQKAPSQPTLVQQHQQHQQQHQQQQSFSEKTFAVSTEKLSASTSATLAACTMSSSSVSTTTSMAAMNTGVKTTTTTLTAANSPLVQCSTASAHATSTHASSPATPNGQIRIIQAGMTNTPRIIQLRHASTMNQQQQQLIRTPAGPTSSIAVHSQQAAISPAGMQLKPNGGGIKLQFGTSNQSVILQAKPPQSLPMTGGGGGTPSNASAPAASVQFITSSAGLHAITPAGSMLKQIVLPKAADSVGSQTAQLQTTLVGSSTPNGRIGGGTTSIVRSTADAAQSKLYFVQQSGFQQAAQHPQQQQQSTSLLNTAYSSAEKKTGSAAATPNNRAANRSKAVRTSAQASPAVHSSAGIGSSGPLGLSAEERDMLAIKTLVKGMLDKLEKDERQEIKRRKSRENQLMTRWRQQTGRNSARLQRNTDAVRKEMIRKRAAVQAQVQQEVDSEIAELIKCKKRKEEERKNQQQQQLLFEQQQQKKQQQENKKKSSKARQQQQQQQPSTAAGSQSTAEGASTASVVRTGQTSVKIRVAGTSFSSTAAAATAATATATAAAAVVSAAAASSSSSSFSCPAATLVSSFEASANGSAANNASESRRLSGSEHSSSSSVNNGSPNINTTNNSSNPESVKKATATAATTATTTTKAAAIANDDTSILLNNCKNERARIASKQSTSVATTTVKTPNATDSAAVPTADQSIVSTLVQNTATTQTTTVEPATSKQQKTDENSKNDRDSTTTAEASLTESSNKTAATAKSQQTNEIPKKTAKYWEANAVTSPPPSLQHDKRKRSVSFAVSSPSDPSVSLAESRPKRQRKTHNYSRMDAILNASGDSVSHTKTNKARKLYCICRQPYDSKRFMVGCEFCDQWFHCDCLKIQEDLVKQLGSFVCAQCRVEYADELTQEQLAFDLPDAADERFSKVTSYVENSSDKSAIADDHHDGSTAVKRKADVLASPGKGSATKQAAKATNGQAAANAQKLSIKHDPSDYDSDGKSSSPNDEEMLSEEEEAAVVVVKKSVVLNRKAETPKRDVRRKSDAVGKTTSSSVKAKGKKKEELYCLCQTPYNESQFYLCCDRCLMWFHGRCVGVLCKEAEKIDVYLCPKCDPKSTINSANQKTLDTQDFEGLKRLLRQIKQNHSAQPFLRPVDERQVPNYYQVITEPMDLQTIESKLNKQTYRTLTSFIGDVTKIFDNCRYFNDTKSSVTQCADSLEKFFVQKITQFREQMILN